ncbi:conserved hypothetical protein [Halothiobacillus neapolitanus c2]|uniref:Uncharacterized protein n=2 Tax=Halothiobacillus neapolitanus TaxID=927 RepID=D0KXZ3_HALNC|nr:antitoxin Xre/MbcA/ParS toxin-binding domain-containing protein [Halothiobacillus neapolitanus]ACX95316.1 conserved hypothetical protein [Halothiobacillus neapolitanus c2]TDN58300.1 putative toxin-antitoxin system antitoxin component (TIGR02293 family) [Halothiobacillus neapolitanus]
MSTTADITDNGPSKVERFRPSRTRQSGPTRVTDVVELYVPHAHGAELVRFIHQGLDLRIVKDASASINVPQTVFLHWSGIKPHNLKRRAKSGTLSAAEGESALRVMRVYEAAVNLFEGDTDAAKSWLETPAPALGGTKPGDLLHSETGAVEVMDLITRIEYGVYS